MDGFITHITMSMKTCCLLVMVILSLNLQTEAALEIGHAFTSKGYCDTEYGKIPVGGVSYDDKNCLAIECKAEQYTVQSCGSVDADDLPANCKLVAKPGHYPNCCKQFIQCDGPTKG